MNRSAQHHPFFLSGHLFSIPGNSNLFLYPLKVRVIGIPLYYNFSDKIWIKRARLTAVGSHLLRDLRHFISVQLQVHWWFKMLH